MLIANAPIKSPTPSATTLDAPATSTETQNYKTEKISELTNLFEWDSRSVFALIYQTLIFEKMSDQLIWEKSKVAAGEEENINCKNSIVYLPNIKLRIKDFNLTVRFLPS